MFRLIVDGKPARIYNARPLRGVPKTYRKVKTCYHNIGNLYNPSWLTLYKAKDGTYRFEIYRDGSIFPYYGRLYFD